MYGAVVRHGTDFKFRRELRLRAGLWMRADVRGGLLPAMLLQAEAMWFFRQAES